MSNPLYGSFLLDDEQVEKALKTPEGIARVSSLTLSMKKKVFFLTSINTPHV
jgi:hypothetical protein